MGASAPLPFVLYILIPLFLCILSVVEYDSLNSNVCMNLRHNNLVPSLSLQQILGSWIAIYLGIIFYCLVACN